MQAIFLLFMLLNSLNFTLGLQYQDYPYPCDHKVFCYGEILHEVQMNEIFEKDRQFLEMKMKYDTETVLKNYEKLKKKSPKPSKDNLKVFVEENFEEEDVFDLTAFDPNWVENPPIFDKIQSESLKRILKMMYKNLKPLYRKMKTEVKEHQERYTLLYLNDSFYVHGDQYKDLYYSQSSWLTLALEKFDITQSSENIANHFLGFVKTFGFVPRSNRIFSNRISSLPILIPLVDDLKDHFISNIELLEKEFQFWMEHRTVEITHQGVQYRIAHFGGQSKGPRPEHYREDYENAQTLRTEEERENYYLEIKVSAESGWVGPNSRWIIGEDLKNFSNFKPSQISPVDLNAVLCDSAAKLATMYDKIGNIDKKLYYMSVFEEFVKSMEKLFWHEDVGIWLDFDMVNKQRRNKYFSSNFAPLWKKCYTPETIELRIYSILAYIEKNSLLKYEGIPASLQKTGQAWDFPFAWAPYHFSISYGFRLTGSNLGEHLAFEIATKFVKLNLISFKHTGKFYGRLNVERRGFTGYQVPESGLGWTGGVVINFICEYHDLLELGSIASTVETIVFVKSYVLLTVMWLSYIFV